jgi:hypothetical protein
MPRDRASVPFWWAVGSLAGMALGAFGPWVTVVGFASASVAGTDGSNDGWVVVAAAVAALVALLVHIRRPRIITALVVALAGLSQFPQPAIAVVGCGHLDATG